FGMRVEVDGKFGAGGDLAGCKLWVGAELWVKAGFDLLITKTNNEVYCDGYGVRGIHNWYATGQAFLDGGMKVGLDYDCGVVGSGTKDLLSATLTAYVFAQLPKPSYLIGEISLDFKILGIGGHASVKVKLGDQCQVANSDKTIVFISSILPDSASLNVKVTEQIIINFAKPIEKFKFNLPDENSTTGATKEYWASVGPDQLSITSGGRTIAYTSEWNSDMTSLRLSPLAVLPENALIKVDVSVVIKNSGDPVGTQTEHRTITFTTAAEPTQIDVANIAYSYPLPAMDNYYKSEFNTGYVKLFTLPFKPMVLPDGYIYNVVFSDGGTEVARVTEVTSTNMSGAEQFVYTIPNNSLDNSKTYTLSIYKVNTKVEVKMGQDKDNSNISLGYESVGADTLILTYDFTTSRFNSFSEKVAYYNQSTVEVSGPAVTNSLSPNSNDIASNTAEDFSNVEVQGYYASGMQTTKPLMRSLGADFTNGFPISGAPDSVSYSFYANKLVVAYDVFVEIDADNTDSKLQDIVCTVNQTSANCGAGSAAGTTAVFPKGTSYYYKLGYFIPGRDMKTSEVLRSFTLSDDIKLSY
ncbi:MAG TPA: hypothetical protein VK750_01965, partial [Cytophagaceae bacterium]|nr:hypothetical protein [Cytophagaceae bacterium]